MKLNRKLFSAIFFAVILCSCGKDFLDVENTQNLYRQSYVKDLTTMQEYVSGNYVILARFLEDGNSTAYPDLVGDNLKPASVSSSAMIPHYSWSQIPDPFDGQNTVGVSNAKGMEPLWRIGYQAIRTCNFAVEEIDKYRSENPGKADNIRGQALAIRAYIHFKLVNVFAQHYKYTADASHPGIPYIIESDITKPFSRQTVAQVYNSMISDLTTAIQLMPATTADSRLMNRNAAKALLARIYLFKEDFPSAKVLAMEVASDIPLMTIGNGYPDGIFRFTSSSEVLFQLTPRSSGYTTNFLGRYVRPTIRFNATNDIAVILKENSSDVRGNWVTSATGNKWNVTKFPLSATGTPALHSTPAADYYQPVIRSSEMFLTVAEASAKSGDENTARTFLDAIRKRADPSIASLTATGADLIDSIHKERRKELCFENLRMFDLQRWKQGVHRTDVLLSYPTDLPYPSDKAIAPIPLPDAQLGGISQNTGY